MPTGLCINCRLGKNNIVENSRCLSRGGSRLKSDCCKYIDDTNVGGSGGMPPRKIFKFRTPETAFPAFWAHVSNNSAAYATQISWKNKKSSTIIFGNIAFIFKCTKKTVDNTINLCKISTIDIIFNSNKYIK